MVFWFFFITFYNSTVGDLSKEMGDRESFLSFCTRHLIRYFINAADPDVSEIYFSSF
jgi:hypothetical protein